MAKTNYHNILIRDFNSNINKPPNILDQLIIKNIKLHSISE